MTRWYNRRHWLFGSLVAVLVLDAVAYFGWVRNPVVVADADPVQVELLGQEVAELEGEVERLERIQAQAPQSGPELERFLSERFAQEATGYSRVNAELDKAARAAGVVLSRVTIDTEEEEEQPELLRVELVVQVEGRYANLLRYLQALEQTKHLYLIDQLGVVAARTNRLQIRMRIVTFLRRNQA